MPRFHQFGLLGTLLGTSLWLVLAWVQHLSLWIVGAMLVTFVSVLLVLAMLTKIVIGSERLVYYHHEIAVLIATAAMLKLIGAPVLAYIDLAVLGLGVFLGCGRLGCWTAGCCYGKPHRHGLRYIATGTPPYGAGVRLIPVALIESAWVFATVIAGVAIVLSSTPGDALAWYTFAYGLGRFGFEFLRGDPDRPYWKGVSEAQWTSWALMTVAAFAEWVGLLPFHTWHIAIAAALTLGIAALVISESTSRALLRPAHLCQLAEALETARALSESTGEIHVGRTSLGLQISASSIVEGGAEEGVDVVAFSCAGAPIPPRIADRLSLVITELWRARYGLPGRAQYRAHANGAATYHLILPARSTHAV